jgi:hypothetical protein
LILTEGEFKCLSLFESGYTAIGLTGLYTYTNQNGVAKLLPEIPTAFDLATPEEIYFIGDSDTSTNLDFSRSAHFLAGSLAPIPVRLPRLALNGPKGVDDLKESTNGTFDQQFGAVLAAAISVAPKISFVALAEALLSLAEKQFALLGPIEFQVQIDRLVKLVAAAQTSGESPLAIDRLESIAVKLAGSTKRKFQKSVEDYLGRQTAQSQQTSTPGKKTGNTPNSQLIKSYGHPAFFKKDGISKINETFWAAYYSGQKTKLIFEPKEKEFYDYNPGTGIYAPITPDLIRSEIAEAMLKASRDWPDYAGIEGFRNQGILNGVSAHLRGIVEKPDFFNQSSHLVHLGNCTLNFDPSGDFKVENFSPDHRSRNRSPINYDSNATCPEFKRLLLSHLSWDDRELL